MFTCVHARICCSSSPFPHTHDSSVRSLNSQASLFLFSSFPDPLPSRHLVFPLFSPALAVHSASLRVESVRVSSRVEYRVSSSSLCAAERGTHRASRGSDPSNRLYISNRIVYSYFSFLETFNGRRDSDGGECRIMICGTFYHKDSLRRYFSHFSFFFLFFFF